MLAGAELLRDDFGVEADVWSVTSFTELRRDGMEAERWNMLHPGEEPRVAVRRASSSAAAPARWSPRPTTCARSPTRSARGSPRPYRVLGTDGFGRSDYRKTLRAFFEVDRHHVALAALTELAQTGEVDADAPKKAIESYEIDPERPAPWRVEGGDDGWTEQVLVPDIGDFDDVR